MGHCDVFGFSGRQGNLSLKARCPNDRTTCVENNPSAAGFRSNWIVTSELLVPKSGEVGVAITSESLVGIWCELESYVTSFLEISYEIESGVSMWLAWI